MFKNVLNPSFGVATIVAGLLFTLASETAVAEPSVLVNESGGSTNVTEGATTDSYTVSLSTAPSSSVTIVVNPESETRELSVEPSFVIFGPGDFNTPQTITVSAVDDSSADGTHIGLISHQALSADTNYSNIGITDVTVTITDNDGGSVIVSETGGSTTAAEGGAGDSYTLALTWQPSADVTITLASDSITGSPLNQVKFTPATVKFTTANYATPQAITVTAVDDTEVEGSHSAAISHAVSSSDEAYNGVPVNEIVVSITDNDSPGSVVMTESGSSTQVIEGGAGDTYTLVLTSKPGGNVTVVPNAGNQLTVDPATVTFTPENFNTPQIIAVNAVDDSQAEAGPPHTGTISHNVISSDADYNSAAVNDVVVAITDNDTRNVIVTESNGSTSVSEDGVTDRYTLALTLRPIAEVTITINPGTRLSVSPSRVTFTAANHTTPKTITVAAIDDAMAEGKHTGILTHSVSSSDGGYNGISVNNVVVDIADNDLVSARSDAGGSGGGSLSILTLAGLLVLGRLRLGFVSKLSLGQAQTFSTAASLMLALASGTALADPPGELNEDAPSTFEDAVLIAADTDYGGRTNTVSDVDYYKFDVAEGQDIFFQCDVFVFLPPYFFTRVDCVATLVDPMGNDRNSVPLDVSVENAEAGPWRVRVENGIPSNWHANAFYAFRVDLVPAASFPGSASGGDGTGGGAFGLLATLLLATAALGRNIRGAPGAAFAIALVCGPVLADPPYGDDFDAPATFEEAVLIAAETSYEGTTGSAGDVDYYKFEVAEGQDIHFYCWLDGTWIFVPPYYYYNQDCVSTLIDPEGNERNSNPLVNPISSPYFEGANAGEWRVRIENRVPNNSASSSYIFGVSVQSGSPASTGDGGGGGGVSDFLSALFGALAFLRRFCNRRGKSVAAIVLLAAIGIEGCGSSEDVATDKNAGIVELPGSGNSACLRALTVPAMGLATGSFPASEDPGRS